MKGQLLHSEKYKAVRRRQSYTVTYRDSDNSHIVKYGLIQFYLKLDQGGDAEPEYVAVIQQLAVVKKTVKLPIHIQNVAHERHKIVPVNYLGKLCIFLQDRDSVYMGKFPKAVESE